MEGLGNTHAKAVSQQDISTLLSEFRRLPEDWDGEGSPAPSHKALNAAERLIAMLGAAQYPAYHATPGPNGEIMVSFRAQGTCREMEIIFYPERDVVIHLPPHGKPEQGRFEWSDLHKHIDWLEGNA